MSQDEYYQDRAHRLDTLAGPNNATYWMMLAKLSDEWQGGKDPMFGMPKQWATFGCWCEDVHGFRPQYDDDGGITGHPVITDEHKYTLCLLKYSG